MHLVKALLLGTAQDGGLPQSGCFCNNCMQLAPRNVVSLALVEHAADDGMHVWLIDPTPDVKQQLRLLHDIDPNFQLRGVFITHLHVGHYMGLTQFGKEVMNTDNLPVHASQSVCDWLMSNEPWRTYVEDHNIVLHPIQPHVPVHVGACLSVTPLPVPHRHDFSDTMAFIVNCCCDAVEQETTQNTRKRVLLYCPDTDGFPSWTPSLSHTLASIDIALVDGTFFDAHELPGRDLKTIPHPFACDTIPMLHAIDKNNPDLPKPTGTWTPGKPGPGPFTGTLQGKEIVLVHLNHSNPLWRGESVQRRWVEERGVGVAEQGDAWVLCGEGRSGKGV